ncbi:hypothetical protein [Halocynthiibacter namhaensis]|nr:hypothetical protein [Halocynthiibacter namhaensis]
MILKRKFPNSVIFNFLRLRQFATDPAIKREPIVNLWLVLLVIKAQ